ncbi:hypothetical protein DPMN_130224 [Dreissena polymorpha]|uniref:Uncharacterized protein n=1 Tax=Dreissena polymorpha TaxID=45954 RepID=A0A9D4H2M6_DREPO|nr:hypothetical protein DPMN_130224 [Dreissena polymorpha]
MEAHRQQTDRRTDEGTTGQTDIQTDRPQKHDHDIMDVIKFGLKVLTSKKGPAPWQPYIIGMNLLTKFHEDRTANILLKPHVFQANIIIFELIQNIIETNLLTKFHEDWK